MKSSNYANIRGAIAGLMALGLVMGCAESKQGGDVVRSGFLDDYSILRKGGKGEARLVYFSKNVSWNNYRNVILEPVSYWRDRRSSGGRHSHEDMRRLANNFYILLHESLSRNYKIVVDPGPGTMRFQVAITDADKSEPLLDKVSTIVPMSLAVTSLKGYVTGKPGFVGEASIEVKLTDAQSGELLAAGVDRRSGGKRLRKGFGSWDDVDAIMRFWAKQAAYRLCLLRKDTNCVKPKT